jgi:hypothetical protein
LDIGKESENIYIDFNNDNDLTNDEVITFPRIDKETGKSIKRNTTPVHFNYYLNNNGKRTQHEIDFLLTRSTRDSSSLRRINPDMLKKQSELQIDLLENAMWKIQSCMSGKIELNDKEYKIALMENRLDGMFRNYDDFLIDMNGDNKLDLNYDFTEQLRNGIFMADNKIYKIRDVSIGGDLIEIEEAPDTPVESLPFAVGVPVPHVLEKDVYGKKMELKDYLGKTVLLRFTSTRM